MKKLSLLFIMALFGLSSLVKADIPDYVITDDGVKYYSRVRLGFTNLVGIENNERNRYRVNEINTYMKDGRIYERMPVVVNNQKTGRYTFMELVTYRNGLKVYKNRVNEFHPVYEYFVFKGQEFVLQFDERNVQSLNNFFFKPYDAIASK